MKKLPIGIQDFARLRQEDFLYVDKTELIYRLATEGVYYFLSRPRRFGKSLLVSTLAELFQGHRELFEGLWIYDRWDWTKQHPVLDFRFNNASYKVIGLEAFLTEELALQAESFGIDLRGTSYPSQLRHLIVALAKQHGQVVVLIDEYDKPILDYLHDIKQAQANREVLKNFYSVLKPLDPHLRFVLLTGVSKFSRVSIFSELYNLLDLTIYSDYATLLGYTQSELEHYFAERIDQLAPRFGGREALLTQIKQWYNGYSWDATHYVYNPFSILSFFAKKSFENFWFETGTPTFLVKLLQREGQYQFDEVTTSPLTFNSFELERIHPHALLFQAGYLTFKARQGQMATLTYPNYEVKSSLLQYLLGEYTYQHPNDTAPQALRMSQALQEGDIEQLVQALNGLFASIPYQIFIADREAFYHAVTFLALSLTGIFVQVEVSQAKGRPDAVVHTQDTIYVLEFKLDASAEAALEQIRQQGYATPYLGQSKVVKAVGLNFNAEQKAVDQWQEKVVQPTAH